MMASGRNEEGRRRNTRLEATAHSKLVELVATARNKEIYGRIRVTLIVERGVIQIVKSGIDANEK